MHSTSIARCTRVSSTCSLNKPESTVSPLPPFVVVISRVLKKLLERLRSASLQPGTSLTLIHAGKMPAHPGTPRHFFFSNLSEDSVNDTVDAGHVGEPNPVQSDTPHWEKQRAITHSGAVKLAPQVSRKLEDVSRSAKSRPRLNSRPLSHADFFPKVRFHTLAISPSKSPQRPPLPIP